MLQKTSCLKLVAQTTLSPLTGAVQEMIRARGGTPLEITQLPDLHTIFPTLSANGIDEVTPYPKIAEPQVVETAIILHSSGSTGLPKPIYLSHRFLLEWSRSRSYLLHHPFHLLHAD